METPVWSFERALISKRSQKKEASKERRERRGVDERARPTEREKTTDALQELFPAKATSRFLLLFPCSLSLSLSLEQGRASLITLRSRRGKSSAAFERRKEKQCSFIGHQKMERKNKLFFFLPSIGSAAPSSRGSLSGCIAWAEPPDVRLLRAAGGCCDELLFSWASLWSSTTAAASSKIAPSAAGSSCAASAPCDGDGERDAARVRRPRRGGTVNVPSPLLERRRWAFGGRSERVAMEESERGGKKSEPRRRGAEKEKLSLALSPLTPRSLTLSPLSSACNFVSLFCFFTDAKASQQQPVRRRLQ